MWLVVGLGNPGQTYRNQRHNIGFMAVDAIHSHFAFGATRSKFHSEVCEGGIAGVSEKVLLLKPQTFMNESGRAVQAAAAFHKIPLTQIIVLHDDLDLAPGQIKLKQGGGAGGHNGLRSLDAHIGNNYLRLRLGIGHPGIHHPEKAALVHTYVLSDFAKGDKAWLEPLLEKLAKHFPTLLTQGPPAFLQQMKTAD